MPSVFEKEEERKNLLDMLRKTRKALKTDDSITLKELSNRTVHSASIHKDPDSIAIAITVYALSKIIERKKYTGYEEWPPFFRKVCKNIDKSIEDIEKKNLKKFRADLKDIRTNVNALSGHLKMYIQDIFRKAQINKASRLYEHGISAAETANLFGITQFELVEYAGHTGIADVNLSVTIPIKDRIKFARQLFS